MIENVEISVFTSLGLLVQLNLVFMIYGIIINFKANKRTKAIAAAKISYNEAVKEAIE